MRSAIDDRYERDPKFSHFVNTIYGLLVVYEFTPTETREACMMAQVKFELSNPRPIAISQDLMDQINIGKIERFKPDWERFK